MPLEPGAVFGDYKVLELLGSGGMGQVYKVQNLLSHRIEALKVLIPDLRAQGDQSERFLREIQVHASLTHPSIAAMYTALRLENQFVMLMEFVEGATLEHRLQSGGLPVAECLRFTTEILGALSYAHQHGVVHRDIKPGNIMLTPTGTVKLMDFGLAASAVDKRLTRSGMVVGSVYYMAPEQVNGNLPTPQSDIYSLGLTVYEMLTGQRAIRGDSDYALMTAQLTQLPEAPDHLNPSVPCGLSAIVLKAVAKNPADRFQTAGELQQALTAFQAGPPAASSIPARGDGRRGLHAALAVAALLAAGSLIFRYTYSRPSGPSANTTSVATPTAAVPQQVVPQVVAQPRPKSVPATPPPTKVKSVAQASTPAETEAAATPVSQPDENEPTERESVRREIVDVVTRLQAAYAAKDFPQLRSLWPSATQPALREWTVFFNQSHAAALNFRLHGDPAAAGSRAVVHCRFRKVAESGDDTKPGRVARVLLIGLTRMGSGWVVDSISFAPPGQYKMRPL